MTLDDDQQNMGQGEAPSPPPSGNFDIHKSIKLLFPEFDESTGSVDDYFADIGAWMRLSKVTDQRDKFQTE